MAAGGPGCDGLAIGKPPPNQKVESEADAVTMTPESARALPKCVVISRALFDGVGAEPDERSEQGERDQKRDGGIPQGIGRKPSGKAVHDRRRFGLGRIRHPHTFSTSGRPSRPDGMKIRTIARIENAATSLYCA